MNKRMWICCVFLLCCVAMSSVPGCGKRKDKWTEQRPPVYVTTGQVLNNGVPVDKAVVKFQPIDSVGKPGFAVTDADGRFEVQTFDPGDGLTAGKHRVAIQKVQLVDAQGNVLERLVDDRPTTEQHLLPEKYSTFSKSGLEVTIEADKKNKLEPFDLK